MGKCLVPFIIIASVIAVHPVATDRSSPLQKSPAEKLSMQAKTTGVGVLSQFVSCSFPARGTVEGPG